MSVHIEAKQGEIAESILLPDPLRAKYIAETFLEDVTCYNNVRGMLGFTGTYKGKRICSRYRYGCSFYFYLCKRINPKLRS